LGESDKHCSHIIDIRSALLKIRSHANNGAESFQKRTSITKSLFQSHKIDYKLVSILLTFHLITTHLWLSWNMQQIAWDQVRHFFNAVEVFQIVSTSPNLCSLLTFSEYYRPFFYLATLPFMQISFELFSVSILPDCNSQPDSHAKPSVT